MTGVQTCALPISYQPQYEKYLDQVAEEVEKLIESLYEGMKPKVIKEDIW